MRPNYYLKDTITIASMSEKLHSWKMSSHLSHDFHLEESWQKSQMNTLELLEFISYKNILEKNIFEILK